MDQKTLKIILEHKKNLVPLIFTQKQIDVIKKYSRKQILSNAEKKAMYTSITNKIKLLNLFKENLIINGINEIIPSRLEEAKKLLLKEDNLSFIAGSFLYSKTYNDIDIYHIVKKGYKEEFKENQHHIYLTESRLKEAVFQSAALISVSNFNNIRKYTNKKPFLNELMSLYHESIIEITNKTKPDSLRDLIFMCNLYIKDKLLTSKELKDKVNNITIKETDSLFNELSKKLFSKTYLYVEIHDYINTLNKTMKNMKVKENIAHYKKNYEELIYGNKAKA